MAHEKLTSQEWLYQRHFLLSLMKSYESEYAELRVLGIPVTPVFLRTLAFSFGGSALLFLVSVIRAKIQ